MPSFFGFSMCFNFSVYFNLRFHFFVVFIVWRCFDFCGEFFHKRNFAQFSLKTKLFAIFYHSLDSLQIVDDERGKSMWEDCNHSPV